MTNEERQLLKYKMFAMFVGAIVMLFGTVAGFVAEFMLYRHVEAPMILWVLFWIKTPIIVIAQVLLQVKKRNDLG